MKRTSITLVAASITLFVSSVLMTPNANAETGVTDTEIVLGTTSALTGPRRGNGVVALGTKLYFDRLNKKGGVNGRKVRVVTTDDEFDARKSADNVKMLVEKENVFAVTSCMGTAQALAVLPFLTSRNVPYLFARTGVAALRDPGKKGVVNLRVSYEAEIAGSVDYIVNKQGIKDIGVFVEDSPFGVSNRAGVQKALAKLNLQVKGIGTHPTKGEDQVDVAIDELKKAGAKAVILGTAPGPSAHFIKKAHAKGYTPEYFGISIIGAQAITKALGGLEVKGLYLADVYPDVSNSKLPIIGEFREAMKDLNTPPDNAYLEGYLAGAVIHTALEKVGKDVTRVKFLAALEGMKDVDLQGIKLNFNTETRELLRTAYLVKVGKGGAVEEL